MNYRDLRRSLENCEYIIVYSKSIYKCQIFPTYPGFDDIKTTMLKVADGWESHSKTLREKEERELYRKLKKKYG